MSHLSSVTAKKVELLDLFRSSFFSMNYFNLFIASQESGSHFFYLILQISFLRTGTVFVCFQLPKNTKSFAAVIRSRLDVRQVLVSSILTENAKIINLLQQARKLHLK
ncbi:hypothetical protein B9Z55_024939 [Caenorhabditis nigoni]|uniref:Uncharacterized protein n=1 Tax=Caenorhabditis nigoni TaxID=1611254 RepID=A0A2G5SWF7_9PELO|nr:hypothetical protein B9Z55_024939 [Caenorhabditis nigoni]